MSEGNEGLFIVENQSLDVDEQKKKNILDIIKSCNSLQDAIGKLEEEKLIWYLIGPLRKDEEVRRQIGSKWETDFQKFKQSVNETHKKFEELFQGKSFLAYSTEGNNFNIRFENEEKPVKISDILRASNEREVYNISLGENSQITACRKNGNERHYNFTGSSSCEMTINWQARDSKGNNISCNMTVKVGLDGILGIIGEPKFGDLKFTDPLPEETENEILKLVEQNEEVFINGKTLYQAFADMGKYVDNQQITEERFTPVSPALDSSGYFSLGSQGSSVSISSEFESGAFDDEEEYKQEEKELEGRIKELEEENVYLRKENAELKSRNQKITEEGDKYRLELMESEERVKGLETELKRSEEANKKRFSEQDEEIRQLKQQISILEQKLKDKDSEIEDLKSQLADEKDKVQSTDKINEELRRKLEQSEAELNVLQEENMRLKNDMKEVSAVKGNYEKQSAELLSEKEKELNDTKNQLSEEQLKNQELAKELNQLQKEKEDLERKIQQSNIGDKSFADEIGEVSGEKSKEMENLEEEIKRKDETIQQIVGENQRLEKKLRDLDKKYSEVKGKDREYIENLTRELEQAKGELLNNEGNLTGQIEELEKEKENLLEQLRVKSTDSASFKKQQSEIDKLKYQLKEKEGMLTCTQGELKSAKESLEQVQNILQQEKSQRETLAASTKTEVKRESREIQISDHVETETVVPKTQNQGTQAVDKSSSKKISGLRQENKNLTRDKLTISEQLKQRVGEIGELKTNLKQLQEENEQLKQKATKNIGVDTSSLADQKETKGIEVQTDLEMKDSYDLYDIRGKRVKTKFLNPKSTSVKDPEKSR